MSDEKMKDIEGDMQMQDVMRDPDDRGQGRKGKVFFRKKVCRFCTQKTKIDYKDADGLRREQAALRTRPFAVAYRPVDRVDLPQ